MFTGIIEEIGFVVSLELRGDVELWDGSVGEGYVLVVRCSEALLEDAIIGCSIAVSGVCLTVVAMTSSTFTAHLAPETLRRTNLGSLKAGDGVNLERSVTASTRMGGHFVQGHVDCAATLVSSEKDGSDSLALRLQLPAAHAHLFRFIVEKGYVALDGTSLTVTSTRASDRSFTVMLIPHTQRSVVLPRRAVGDAVNLEVDCMAKYVAAEPPTSSSSSSRSEVIAWTALAVSVAALVLVVARTTNR